MKKSPKLILSNSLEELLETRSFDRITVGDIVENCGISRTTLYRHFKDKFDCMNWVYQSRISKIIEENYDISSWKKMTVQTAELLYEKKDYFSKVNNYTEQNSLIECIYQYGMKYATDVLRKEEPDRQLSREEYYMLHMYLTASVEAINIWLREGCPGGPEFLSEVQCNCMPEALRKYFA